LLTGCEGVTMVFENDSDESLNYYWLVNESDSLFDYSNELIYNFGDRVDVALYVENSNGCYDSTSLDFYLEDFDEYFKVSLPNVFTPNFDGDNDIFRVDMAGKLNECSELSVFNRWGQLVYSSNGRTPQWNGKNYSGLDVPTGQYYFQLLIKEKSFDGKFYLFR
jgi:gliding motility-associated-like protein